TVHKHIVLLICESLNWGKNVEPKVLCHSSQMLTPVTVQVIPVKSNSPIRKTKFFIRNNKVRVKFHLEAEPVTGFTGSKRTVEGEHPGLEFFESHSADRTCHI